MLKSVLKSCHKNKLGITEVNYRNYRLYYIESSHNNHLKHYFNILTFYSNHIKLSRIFRLLMQTYIFSCVIYRIEFYF